MSLPPLDERSLENLKAELGKLHDTYKECAKMLSPSISPHGARALDRINDAMDAIQKEIETRGTVNK